MERQVVILLIHSKPKTQNPKLHIKKAPYGAFLIWLVPKPGIEPGWGYPRGILSPLRLPIPPLRHGEYYNQIKQKNQPLAASY